MITFLNDGIVLQSTNYFDTPMAKAGEFYLSWNAGCARFLVPDIQKHLLPEMKTAKQILLAPIPGGLEIVFDDGSDLPFLIHIAQEQTDRILTKKDIGAVFQFSVYIRWGEKYAFPGIIE
jgi:hypothetical protein